jgi:hypothetical protein
MFRRAIIISAAVAVVCTFTPRIGQAVSLSANETAELSSRLADLPGRPNRRALDAALSSYLSALSRGAVARSSLLTLWVANSQSCRKDARTKSLAVSRAVTADPESVLRIPR